MDPDSWMRAADQDREETVGILWQAHAEGQLDTMEASRYRPPRE